MIIIVIKTTGFLSCIFIIYSDCVMLVVLQWIMNIMYTLFRFKSSVSKFKGICINPRIFAEIQIPTQNGEWRPITGMEAGIESKFLKRDGAEGMSPLLPAPTPFSKRRPRPIPVGIKTILLLTSIMSNPMNTRLNRFFCHL